MAPLHAEIDPMSFEAEQTAALWAEFLLDKGYPQPKNMRDALRMMDEAFPESATTPCGEVSTNITDLPTTNHSIPNRLDGVKKPREVDRRGSVMHRRVVKTTRLHLFSKDRANI